MIIRAAGRSLTATRTILRKEKTSCNRETNNVTSTTPTIPELRAIALLHHIPLKSKMLKKDILQALADKGITNPQKDALLPETENTPPQHNFAPASREHGHTIRMDGYLQNKSIRHYITRSGRTMTQVNLKTIKNSPQNGEVVTVTMSRSIFHRIERAYRTHALNPSKPIALCGFLYTDDRSQRTQMQCCHIGPLEHMRNPTFMPKPPQMNHQHL